MSICHSHAFSGDNLRVCGCVGSVHACVGGCVHVCESGYMGLLVFADGTARLHCLGAVLRGLMTVAWVRDFPFLWCAQSAVLPASPTLSL